MKKNQEYGKVLEKYSDPFVICFEYLDDPDEIVDDPDIDFTYYQGIGKITL